MVQETDEYIVIKLTKEQVLEEMKQKSQSVKYLTAPYKCEKCIKGFNFEEVLQTHMEKHTIVSLFQIIIFFSCELYIIKLSLITFQKNGSLLCELCSQYCPSAVSMRGHWKSHTTR